MDTCACLTMNGVGKPCAGEPHARFDRGPLGKLTHPAGAAGPGPVRWKTPPDGLVGTSTAEVIGRTSGLPHQALQTVPGYSFW